MIQTKKTGKIKAVMFDMGGVIVGLDLKACLKAFKEKAGFEDVDNYLNEYRQHGYIGEMEDGKINEEEFYAETLKHCRPGTTEETIRDCFKDFLPCLIKDILQFIRELHEQGYPLYILSNNNPICARIVEAMMASEGIKINDYFEKVFYSHEVKISKPKAEIYRLAISGTGCKAEEIVFIEDNHQNIEGARKEGIKTIEFSEGMDIRGAFKALNN